MNRMPPRSVGRMMQDEKGTTAVLFGLLIVPMVGLIALAVDYAHIMMVQDRMQSSVDGAIVAAMKEPNLTKERRIEIANAYFKANFYTSEFKNSTVVVDEAELATLDASDKPADHERAAQIREDKVVPTFTVNDDGTMLAQVDSQFRSPVGSALFNRLLAVPVLNAEAKATVEAEQGSGQKLEVGMMIDLTGSMGSTRNGSTKIAGLKTAAADLLDILYPSGDNPNVRVAIAPMADYVNAGEFAAEVTGLSDTGSFAKSTNLTSTKQGPFSGSYSGYYGNSQPTGSQHGATSASASTAGATFTSTHCTAGNQYETKTRYGQEKYVGRKVSSSTPGRIWANNGYYKKSWEYDHGRWGWDYDYESDDDWILPYSSTNCTEAADQSGKLVTCVTERNTSATRYTDAAPSSGNYVGPYNQSASGTTNKLNYSADGKCYVGGRELPAVIPLTSSKSTLENFFINASIGGATPGHLGHAWAWYMISPNWSSIWPSDSKPADYTDAGTKKVAIIMTDGEYNTQYSNATSKTQALALCQSMKDAGVIVYTIGFGFSTTSTAGDGTSEGNAKQILTQCSSGTNHYYFPYDSAALREVFQSIGDGLMTGNTTVSKLKLKN